MRPTSLLWLGVILATGVAVFTVKSNVATLEEELVAVRRGIAEDRAAIHVLNAEWSFLNQPSRLAELAGRYLTKLQPIATVQYAAPGRLDLLPWKPGSEPAPGVAFEGPAPGPAVARIERASR
jgi:hypothetical protein